jgi:2,4-dienoyl-CoA reductase (NADPH2)
LITHGEKHEHPTWIEIDNIVMCAGQLPLQELKEPLDSAGIPTHVIGGADVATELDAKRAIDQGSRLAARL